MNYKYLLLVFVTAFACQLNMAQSVVEDFKPSSVNQPGKLFPQVNSEGRIRVSIPASEAQKVQLDISGVKYDLKKDEKGVCGQANRLHKSKVFIIINSMWMELPFPIREVCISTEQVAGEVLLKFRPPIRIFML